MIKTLTLRLIDAIYPAMCQICGIRLESVNTRFLCEDCREQIEHNKQPFCAKCGRHLEWDVKGQDFCADCMHTRFSFARAQSACLYTGTTKKCIQLLKYSKRLCLLRPLSELLKDFAIKHVDIKRFDWVVPVPLHRTTFANRGFNQAHLLAKGLARDFRLKVFTGLKKSQVSESQSKLTQDRRRKNIKGAFTINNGRALKNKSALLIDDVLTTGSTANECSRILRYAGAKYVEVLTLARG